MTEATTTTTRKRRTPDEIIADLQAKIDEAKQRKAATELKNDPAVQSATRLARDLQKGMAIEDGDLRAALKAGLDALASYLESKGLGLPKPRKRRTAG